MTLVPEGSKALQQWAALFSAVPSAPEWRGLD